MASRHAGTLEIRDTPEALEIEATLSGGTSWARDFIEAHRAGLIRGLSPGFRVSPGGERIERAELFEISTVTRPAYPASQIEARCWAAKTSLRSEIHPLKRWRL